MKTNTMKMTMMMVTAALIMTISGDRASAQAPMDLSYLTNRSALASQALKWVDMIHVTLNVEGAGSPGDWQAASTNRLVSYSGQPSFKSMARALSGTMLALPSAMPDAQASVVINLMNTLPDGSLQYLFSGAAAGKPEYDGAKWILPRHASEPQMYLNSSIFIPVPGLLKAWVVETNSYGWAYKKSLQTWQGYGFFFETTLAGEVILCFEVLENDGTVTQWTYDIHEYGTGRRKPMSSVIAQVSLQGNGSDIRDDYPYNPTEIGHWVYTFKPDSSSLTYGTVPLLIAHFTQDTASMVWVGSSVGYAREFSVTRIADSPGMPEQKFTLVIPANMSYVGHVFKPGLYHIIPLGIPVSADWWKIQEVNWQPSPADGPAKG